MWSLDMEYGCPPKVRPLFCVYSQATDVFGYLPSSWVPLLLGGTCLGHPCTSNCVCAWFEVAVAGHGSLDQVGEGKALVLNLLLSLTLLPVLSHLQLALLGGAGWLFGAVTKHLSH